MFPLLQETAAQAEPSTLSVVAEVAVIVGAILTAGALVYAGRQVQLLRQQLQTDIRHERIRRSFDFISRWNDPTFDEVRANVAGFLRTQPSAEEIEKKRENDEEFRANLSLLVNFLEELGVAWNRRAVNRDVVFDFFGGVVVGYWDWLHSFVVEHRKGVADRRSGIDRKVPRGIWEQFERMHDHMDDRVNEL